MRMDLSRFFTHALLLFMVVLWTLPTVGLLVSSIRDKDQLSVTGWWSALTTTERTDQGRTDSAEAQVQENGNFVISGDLFDGDAAGRQIQFFGVTNSTYNDNPAGSTITLRNGTNLTVNVDGTYRWVSTEPFETDRGQRVLYIAETPPRFTLENYSEVLESEGIGRSFINSFTVTIPATIIPVLIAAFAAYALAWMQFPGRSVLVAVVVGLLVVPLQMSLIPILRLYNGVMPLVRRGK